MAEAVTFTSLRNQLARKQYAPIYFLHGEEGYYIDELMKLFETILPEEERDFNQYVMYAPQVEAQTVVETCRRYPMMADRQVVILKELQSARADYVDKFASYAAQPTSTTILVIASRGKEVKAADLFKKISAAGGVVFNSKKVRDYQLGPVIMELVKEKGLNIESKALAMLQEFVGTDLARVYNEVEKLTMVLGRGAMITPESIERNIGVSKDYNNFELVDALATKNAAKVYRIINYFKANPKNNPTVVTASTLFTYYSNLLIAAYSKDKSERGLMEALGFKWPVQLKPVTAGLRCYNAWQMIAAIDAIRRFDAASKGVGSRADSYDLLRNLAFTLLNTTGR